MVDDADNQTRKMAQAAIIIDSPESASGEKPDMEELWDWMGGRVEAQRAQQIQSHVARDAQIYSQWRELRMALEEAELERPELNVSASNRQASAGYDLPSQAREYKSAGNDSSGFFERVLTWLSPAPLGGAFATAAILGVAISIGMNQSRQQQAFWADWQSPKGLNQADVTVAETDLAKSFLSGMGNRMQELSIPPVGPAGQILNSESDPCASDNQVCNERHNIMRELGKLSVAAKLACVVGQDANADDMQKIRSVLSFMASDTSMQRYLAPVRQWAATNDSDSRCRAVNSLIERGLSSVTN